MLHVYLIWVVKNTNGITSGITKRARTEIILWCNLILGALTNKSFLLQVRFVLNQQSQNPDNPGANLREDAYFYTFTITTFTVIVLSG